MPRYFMHLAYRGAPFHGWQTQPGAVSVQSVIEDALAVIMRFPVKITGAGRTDTGVNARMMIAHFDLPGDIPDPQRFVRSLNSIVGRDISIYSVTQVHDDAHARFDAIARTYHYRTVPYKSPFAYPLTWCSRGRLDFDAMNVAAEALLATSDFTSFAKLHTDTKTNICHVTRAEWIPDTNGGMTFVITADRFLRNMVRAVVGTLVEVGRGKLSVSGFNDVINALDRCAAGTSMPPEALFLWDITYPYYTPESNVYDV